jgi:hypothetical protein
MPKGVLEIKGAEKVVAEFSQGPGLIPYFVLVDSGKKNNLLKLALVVFALLPAVPGIIFGQPLFLYFGIAFLAGAFFVLSLKLLKEGKASRPKEKMFLTEKSFVVQHSVSLRSVKFIELKRIKKFLRIPTPFGTFMIVRHMDLENIDTLSEPLFFPENPDELESSVLEAAVRIQAEELEKKKKEEAEELRKEKTEGKEKEKETEAEEEKGKKEK